jgi:serine protease AprX
MPRSHTSARPQFSLILAAGAAAWLPMLAQTAGSTQPPHHLRVASAAAIAPSRPSLPSMEAGFVELNGQRYQVQKQKVGGEVVHLFSDGRRTFTFEQLGAHLAAQPPRKLSGHLEGILASAPPDQAIPTFIVLTHQPAEPISRQVWAGIAQERDTLAAAMRDITRRALARPSMPEHLERDFIPLPPTPDELVRRRALAGQIDELERDARREIHARIARAIQPDQDEVAVRILELGGEVTARITAMNILGAALTPAAIRALAQSPLVAAIDFDHPGEPELDVSAQALAVNSSFWSNGITGGIFDVGVLDTGVQMNHPALNTHAYLTNMSPPGTDTGDHGTHVAGIMASTNATHRGMAFGSDLIVYARAGAITTSMPGMDYIASTGEAEVCNYSFGNGTASANDYTNVDQFFDGVVNTFGFMVSKSTGNGGFGTGAPTITHPAPAFNLMAVANLSDANTPTRNDDWISSSSSRGPTAGGRRKPDIGAPGTNIMSANKNWATAAHFINMSGTSMAAPHVGGAIVLMYDMGVNNTTASKAILINTADAIEDNGTSGTADDVRVDGSRWNRRYGWGYMHLGKAYLNALDSFEGTLRTTAPRERFRLYAGEMFQHEKATLAWKRHVAYNGATYPTQIRLLSDLDLFAYSEANNTLSASSTSAIDNVEQLSIPQGAFTVLKVKAVGSFGPGITEESFALATQENFTERQGPAFHISIDRPAVVAPGSQFDLRADITNIGDLRAHGVTVTISGAAIASGTNPVNIGAIAASADSFAQWTITAPTALGTHPVQISISSNSYGELFTAQLNGSFIVGELGSCYANCDGNNAPPYLTIDDFTCFINTFAIASELPHNLQITHYANCDASTTAPVLNIEDFTCFINQFALGCP